MALPKQVQQKLDEAAQIEARFQEQQTQSEAEPEATPEGEPEAQPTAEPEPDQEVEPTAEVPEPVVSDAEEQEEAKWEHKYKRLQGKFDAEVPRLYAEVKDLRAQLEDALQQLKAEKQPEPKPEPVQPAVTPEDVDNFGEDLIDLQRRIAREAAREVQAELDKLRADNDALRQQVSLAQGTSFEARLLQAVPDFSEIDANPAWVAWLNEVDPMLRAPRRTMAEAAYKRGDVDAVKSYVELFKQTQKPQPSQTQRQAELQRQVQPPKATSQAPAANQPKYYSQTEVDKAWAKVHKLITQGRIDEAQALDTEISAALVEGRVRA